MPVAIPLAIAGASVVGAVATSSAASKAAAAQTAASNASIASQNNIYNQNKELLDPYAVQGQKAYSTLNDLLGVNGADSSAISNTLENLPGYQFTRDQGLKATQGGYAARGLADSGGALKGAANYSNGLAQSNYNNYATQLHDSANIGVNAGSAIAGVGASTGQSIGNTQVGIGNANAAAANATGAAISGGANNALGGYLYSLNNGLINGQQGTSAAASPTSSWYGSQGGGLYSGGNFIG